MNKREESRYLATLVDAWKQGKRIEIPIERFRSEYEFSIASRCTMCDWSPTNQKSIFNPSIEEYASNKLEIDDLTGKTLCKFCLGASNQMNRAFKEAEEDDPEISRYLVDRGWETMSDYQSDGAGSLAGRVKIGEGSYWVRNKSQPGS